MPDAVQSASTRQASWQNDPPPPGGSVGFVGSVALTIDPVEPVDPALVISVVAPVVGSAAVVVGSFADE